MKNWDPVNINCDAEDLTGIASVVLTGVALAGVPEVVTVPFATVAFPFDATAVVSLAWVEARQSVRILSLLGSIWFWMHLSYPCASVAGSGQLTVFPLPGGKGQVGDLARRQSLILKLSSSQKHRLSTWNASVTQLHDVGLALKLAPWTAVIVMIAITVIWERFLQIMLGELIAIHAIYLHKMTARLFLRVRLERSPLRVPHNPHKKNEAQILALCPGTRISLRDIEPRPPWARIKVHILWVNYNRIFTLLFWWIEWGADWINMNTPKLKFGDFNSSWEWLSSSQMHWNSLFESM